MTNEQIIRSLPLKDLASLVIRHECEENWDYTYGRTILVTSDGLRFDEYNYEDALEHECWWLQQEATAVVKDKEGE